MSETSATHHQFHRAIEEAYIKPIRNIVFIDDEYPTYQGFLSGAYKPAEKKQSAEKSDNAPFTLSSSTLGDDALLGSALNSEQVLQTIESSEAETTLTSKWPQTTDIVSLIQSCEEKYLPYFANSAKPPHGILVNADLLVLDYLLVQGTSDARYCLNILQQLNASHKMSLVVLYTHEEPEIVAQTLTIGLRGCGRKLLSNTGATTTISDEFAKEFIGAYIGYDDDKLKQLCTSSQIHGDIESIHKRLEEYITDKYKQILPTRSTCNNIECGFQDPQHPWIRGDKLFVTVLKKDPNTPLTLEMITSHLTKALCEYHPSPVSIIAQTCINNLTQESPIIIDQLFDSRETKAAILFHALTHDNPTAIGEEARAEQAGNELVQFIMEAITIPASQTAAKQALNIFGELFKSFSTENLMPSSCDSHAQRACLTFALTKELALPKLSNNDELKVAIFERLNATLCSHNNLLDFITTGTVFKCGIEYWVCTSPACDLVPGRNGSQGSYKRELHPANYFHACRLEKMDTTRSGTPKPLKEATSGQYIFIRVADGTDQVFLVLSKDGKPTPHIFYSATAGRLNTVKKIVLHKTKFSEDKSDFEVICEEAEAISQLRPAYASKILQHFGLHNSRIGVDFRNIK